MFRFISSLFGAVALMLFGSLASAGTGAQRLSDFLTGLDTLEARFEQSVLDTENNRTGLFHGVFLLKRPGRFRWDYVSPYTQTILADGKEIWIADDDLEQITRQRQASALRGTPALLLTEDLDIESQFEVVDLGERQGMTWLELVPRDPESQFVRILLAFEAEQLVRMEMADKFGQISRFRFFQIRRNPELDDAAFVFVPPPGYDMFQH
jgi:outer membrane lipoprotein carrier protein